jgi:hypothetical protein
LLATLGVTLALALDATDVPDAFVAVTVKVYAVPDTKDAVTVTGLLAPVPVKLPGLLVTVYPVIVPLPLGAVKATLTCVLSVTVGVPMVGAPGKVSTVSALE